VPGKAGLVVLVWQGLSSYHPRCQSWRDPGTLPAIRRARATLALLPTPLPATAAPLLLCGKINSKKTLKQELIAMFEHDKLIQWAIELQALAQIGLTYTTNVYDRERFERIREIASRNHERENRS